MYSKYSFKLNKYEIRFQNAKIQVFRTYVHCTVVPGAGVKTALQSIKQ